jgi:hypothetical protein
MNSFPRYLRILHVVLAIVIIAAACWLVSENYSFQGRGAPWRTSTVSKNSDAVSHTNLADNYHESIVFQEENSNGTDSIQETNSTDADTLQKATYNMSSDVFPEEKDMDYLPSSCDWSPNDTHACFPLLFHHMQASLNASRSRYRRNSKRSHTFPKRRYINRRWLFLGDSTIYHLVFSDDHLSKYLTEDAIARYQKHRQRTCFSNKMLHCNSGTFTRCDIMSQLSLQPNATWEMPNEAAGEGPTAFGLENAYCTDCRGCESKLLTCSLRDATEDGLCSAEDVQAMPTEDSIYTGPAYGGFAAIEFVRDVELQSAFFKTTQENWLLHYIAQNWNSPEAIEEFGRPMCVVSAGIHDCTVRGITTAIYIQNVEWYVNIVFQQCDYVIWVANNCPLQDDHEQTKALLYEWNMAVQEVLLSSPFFRQNSFFLDVFDSSIDYPHDDNMHMSWSWYGLLASLFRTLMDADIGWYEN